MSDDSSQPDELSEQEILARIVLGESELFRVIVERYEAQILRMIIRQTGDATVARDLTQDTFIRAYSKLPQFRFESALSTWLIRIALNLTNNYFKSRTYKNSMLSGGLSASELPAPDSAANAKERQLTELQRAIGSLSAKHRESLVLCALEGKSYEEAAGILCVPVGTVRSRLNTARLQLRQRMFREE